MDLRAFSYGLSAGTFLSCQHLLGLQTGRMHDAREFARILPHCLLGLPERPTVLLSKIGAHQRRCPNCQTPTEPLQPDPPGQDVFDRDGHLVTNAVNNFRLDAWSIGHDGRHQTPVRPREFENFDCTGSELFAEVLGGVRGNVEFRNQGVPESWFVPLGAG